jgi:RNA polymerase sigma-70 factor, ECF subfamily
MISASEPDLAPRAVLLSGVQPRQKIIFPGRIFSPLSGSKRVQATKFKASCCRHTFTFALAIRMTDARLLKLTRQGDEAAFARLYERHRGLVFRFAYRLSQSPELAEEITHDCFVSLWQAPQRFSPDVQRASLRTYLCAIARNLVFKRLRRLGKETALDEWPEQVASMPEAMPLQQILATEMAEAVRQAVAALPLLQREALILFEYEALTLAEIAEITEVEVNAVKARLQRARARLRVVLAQYRQQRSVIPVEQGCV